MQSGDRNPRDDHGKENEPREGGEGIEGGEASAEGGEGREGEGGEASREGGSREDDGGKDDNREDGNREGKREAGPDEQGWVDCGIASGDTCLGARLAAAKNRAGRVVFGTGSGSHHEAPTTCRGRD
jgi:hypothetical protein